MDTSYFLQLSETERKKLLSSTRKNAKQTGDPDIAAIHDSLEQLEPNHAFLLEIPDEYDASKIKFTSSLEIPVDVMVVRTRGNHVQAEPVEHVRDSERIQRVITALQIGSILTPILMGAELLVRTLADACETTAPDLPAVIGVLHAFTPVLSQGTRKASELAQALRIRKEKP